MTVSIGKIAASAGLFALVAVGCKHAAPTETKATPDADIAVAVSLVPARDVKTPRLVTLSGTLIGSEEAQVAAGAAGKVIATYVERGSVVKKGALISVSRSASAVIVRRASADDTVHLLLSHCVCVLS